MSVRYPIARSAEAALTAALGRAEREREAAQLAGEAVGFARELTGPTFDTREAAAAAYPGLIDQEGAPAVAPEDRWCELMEVSDPAAKQGGGQAEPSFEAGHRWPKPKQRLKTVWRLSVSYWRLGETEPAQELNPDLPQARAARRKGAALDPASLRAIARQPLRPVKPQQPLDIGLFEVRPVEAPHIIMPDE